MKYSIYWFSFILAAFVACKNGSESTKETESKSVEIISNKPNDETAITEEQEKPTLLIEGNNIWVRESPKTGEVAFTLNEGATCYVLEKGESQVIRGNKDFWYKIEYEGKTGWVFGTQTSLKQTLCNFPSELSVHPAKKPNGYKLGVQDMRFFPVGMSAEGVFAYWSFEGEMDPCECVHADLIFYSTQNKSIIKSVPFRTDTEDGPMDGWEEFIDPKKVWESEKEKYCSVLEEQSIVMVDYDVIEGEELATIYQLSSTLSGEESMAPTINYSINDENNEIVEESKEYAQILSAELVAMLRYTIGDDYLFVTIVATTHPGFEGSTIRTYDIF